MDGALEKQGNAPAKHSSSVVKIRIRESKLSPLDEACRRVKTIVLRLKPGMRLKKEGGVSAVDIAPARRILVAFPHQSALQTLHSSSQQAKTTVKRTISGSLRSSLRDEYHPFQGRRSLESCSKISNRSKSPTELPLPRASLCTCYLVDLQICHDCSSQQLHRLAQLRELDDKLSSEAGIGSILKRKQEFKAAPWVESPQDRAKSVRFGS